LFTIREYFKKNIGHVTCFYVDATLAATVSLVHDLLLFVFCDLWEVVNYFPP